MNYPLTGENMSFKGEAPSLTDVQKMKDRMDALFEGVAYPIQNHRHREECCFT